MEFDSILYYGNRRIDPSVKRTESLVQGDYRIRTVYGRYF